MEKFRKTIGCLMPFVAAYACQFVVSLVVSGVYSVVLVLQAGGLGITEEEELLQFVNEKIACADFLLLVTAIATLYTLVIGFFWYKKWKPVKDLKWEKAINAKLIAALALLGISLQLLISMCLNAVFPLLPQDMTENYSSLMETLIGGNPWLSVLTTVVLAPLAEELLFRGVTMKKAQQLMPFMTANILQAALFGVYHGNLIQGAYAFLLGLILGFTAEYFHSIWASILLHAFVNGSAELLNLLPEQLTATVFGVAFLAILAVGFFLLAAKLYPQAREAQIAADTKFRENSFDE